MLLKNDINFLGFNDLPLSLKKLLELINIKLIKLKFNQQSKIIIKDYKLNLNSKFFSKDSLNLKLTEKEIEIILYLNNKKVASNCCKFTKKYMGLLSRHGNSHCRNTHL